MPYAKFRSLAVGYSQLLHTDYNQIADIEPLASCNFPLLSSLHLSNYSLSLDYNQIESIAALTSFNFPKLRTLLLCCPCVILR